GALIPLLVIYKRVGLFDTRLGMILLYAAFNLPLVIWMMRSFFADLPKEILEAASLDGAGFLTIMTRIVLPLTAPGLAATALLSVVFSWNEFLLAVNLTGANSGTLPVFISGFMTSEGLFWAKMSAASTLAVAPVILAGWLAQRSLVRGLTVGAEVPDDFPVGGRVAVEPNISCGSCFYCQRGQVNHCLRWSAIGVTRDGGFADYVVAPATNVYRVGEMDYEVAAFIEPLSCVV